MRYGIGASISLADITGGVLSAGAIPRTRLTRFEGTLSSAGIIDIGAGGTDLLTINVGTCYTGELCFFQAFVEGAKLLVAGQTDLRIEDNASVCDWDAGRGNHVMVRTGQPYVPATSDYYGALHAMIRITSIGQLNIKLRGRSVGSDTRIQAGMAMAHWWVLREV